jgi:SAM-dependent methyltransferase
MGHRVTEPPALHSLPEPIDWRLDMAPRERSRFRHTVERLIALGYGSTYDAIVRSFEPYQALLRGHRLRRPLHGGPDHAAVKILDVACCGTGTVALELARLGYSVVGLDVVEPWSGSPRTAGPRHPAGRLDFQQGDVASAPVGAGTYDVLVTMHTLYWHSIPRPAGGMPPRPQARRPRGLPHLLPPGRLIRTFRDVRARRGRGLRSGRCAGSSRPPCSSCSATTSPTTSPRTSSTACSGGPASSSWRPARPSSPGSAFSPGRGSKTTARTPELSRRGLPALCQCRVLGQFLTASSAVAVRD